MRPLGGVEGDRRAGAPLALGKGHADLADEIVEYRQLGRLRETTRLGHQSERPVEVEATRLGPRIYHHANALQRLLVLVGAARVRRASHRRRLIDAAVGNLDRVDVVHHVFDVDQEGRVVTQRREDHLGRLGALDVVASLRAHRARRGADAQRRARVRRVLDVRRGVHERRAHERAVRDVREDARAAARDGMHQLAVHVLVAKTERVNGEGRAAACALRADDICVLPRDKRGLYSLAAGVGHAVRQEEHVVGAPVPLGAHNL